MPAGPLEQEKLELDRAAKKAEQQLRSERLSQAQQEGKRSAELEEKLRRAERLCMELQAAIGRPQANRGVGAPVARPQRSACAKWGQCECSTCSVLARLGNAPLRARAFSEESLGDDAGSI